MDRRDCKKEERKEGKGRKEKKEERGVENSAWEPEPSSQANLCPRGRRRESSPNQPPGH